MFIILEVPSYLVIFIQLLFNSTAIQIRRQTSLGIAFQASLAGPAGFRFGGLAILPRLAAQSFMQQLS